MGFESKIGYTFRDGNAPAIAGEIVTETEASLREDITVPANTTNSEVDIDFVTARAKSIFIVSDRDVTLKTNDATAPGNTIQLKADAPVLYAVGGLGTNPFTVDVTRFFFTNAAAAGTPAANVKIRVGYDPTP